MRERDWLDSIRVAALMIVAIVVAVGIIAGGGWLGYLIGGHERRSLWVLAGMLSGVLVDAFFVVAIMARQGML